MKRNKRTEEENFVKLAEISSDAFFAPRNIALILEGLRRKGSFESVVQYLPVR
jgi:hypothetical protein